MASLMGIADELRNAIRPQFDEETGELIDNSADVEALQISVDDKIDAYMEWYEELKAEKSARKDKIERLEYMQDMTDKKIEFIEHTLINMMSLLGKKNHKTLTNHISFSTRKKVIVQNEALVPSEFKREKVTITHPVDKDAVKKYIENGGSVEGCQVIDNPSFRVNERKKKTEPDK